VICPDCGTEFEKTVYNKKYCCSECQIRSKRRRESRRIRRDPVRYEKRLEWMRKLYARRRKAGLCPRCGGEPEEGRVSCSNCIEMNRRVSILGNRK